MDEKKLEQIKSYLAEEQELQDRLKKNPNLSTTIAPQLNDIYRKRVDVTRSELGCGVNRDMWDILKSVLLEQANIEKVLNDGISSEKKEDMQRMLTITRNKRDILVGEVERTLDNGVSCPVLPPGESVSSISNHVREKTQSFMEKKLKEKDLEKGKVVEKPKSDDRRKKIIRLLMQ
jgi:hypothetical protein